MKRRITLFIAAVTFIVFAITVQADTSVDDAGSPSGNGFPDENNRTITMSGKHGSVTCPIPGNLDGTKACGKVTNTPHDQGNDPVSGKILL